MADVAVPRPGGRGTSSLARARAGATAAAKADRATTASRSAGLSVLLGHLKLLCQGRLHVGLHSDDAAPARPLHPRTADILSSMTLPESQTDEPRAPLDVLLENHRVFLRYL